MWYKGNKNNNNSTKNKMDPLLKLTSQNYDLTKAKFSYWKEEELFDHPNPRYSGCNYLYVACLDDMNIDYLFKHDLMSCVGVLRISLGQICYEYIMDHKKPTNPKKRTRSLIIVDNEILDEDDQVIGEYYLKIPMLEDLADEVKKRVEDRLQEAATLIQSAFRGWKVRHVYRYDPHNPLGRHLIRKMFDEK